MLKRADACPGDGCDFGAEVGSVNRDQVREGNIYIGLCCWGLEGGGNYRKKARPKQQDESPKRVSPPTPKRGGPHMNTHFHVG